ncbi:S-adenosyl-L-methionine-dependent methyltransferase [Fistulina hepatica ATCC 64428]|uniref:tRNA (cytosine(38)-C(5))-methyltransferase n=1 Tax=Fistulina hepatica ATCC 64428 TaxID=1128425 RepID=A0A0D7AN11_9AGAR|nr:S-adenosyl-L-methionine-dependent methyltransferase [Fistulina hepatica ATCC 64428]
MDALQPLTAIEFYSGIGGLHLALKRCSSCRPSVVVRSYDWDPSAIAVYEHNFGRGIAQRKDISSLTPDTLSAYGADVWLLSPACQPYTVLNPESKGIRDPRAQSFLHLMANVLPVMPPYRRPKYLLVENVGGFETSETRPAIIEILRGLSYNVAEFLLSPLQFGTPNSRQRYYLLAKFGPWASSPTNPGILTHIPPQEADQDPQDVSVRDLRMYLDDDTPANDLERYLVPDKILEKWGRLFDIVVPSSLRTCCFTRGYTRLVERAGSIIQMDESLDTTTVFNEFLVAQAQNVPHAVELLRPLRLRYFSPDELLRLFDFNAPRAIWPPLAQISRKTRYRLIGNSVNVRVVTSLLEYLFCEPKQNQT